MVFHRVVQHLEQFHNVRVVQFLQYRDLPVHPVQGIHRRLDPVGRSSTCNNTLMVIFCHFLGLYMELWNSSFLLLQHFKPLLQWLWRMRSSEELRPAGWEIVTVSVFKVWAAQSNNVEDLVSPHCLSSSLTMDKLGKVKFLRVVTLWHRAVLRVSTRPWFNRAT